MNRELEALLEAWDQFIQIPKGRKPTAYSLTIGRGSMKRLESPE